MGLLEDTFKPKKAIMNVCMMGPKAVGKTTVLTAVFNETQQSIAETTLNLTAKGDTNADLIERLRLLQSVFRKKTEITDNSSVAGQQIISAGVTASAFVSNFGFEFGHIGKESVIDLNLKDFPGEYVVDYPDDVINYIKESQCIFVAIDTPHLMERNGEFNAIKNKPKEITDLFKRGIHAIDSEKLVLFIPLKCEKYFHEGRMQEVLNKVEETYKDLTDMLSETGKICCAVTPIQTLGDVEFDDFSYESDGSVTIGPDRCPAGVKYKYVNDGKYTPRFCSQPLYSLLLFVAAQYRRNKGKHGGFLDWIKRKLWDVFNSDDTLIEEILKMNKNRLTTNLTLGYKVLCGENLFDHRK